MIHLLSRIYRRIGIHSAPPGTLFHLAHSLVRRLVHRRIFGFVSGDPYKRSRYGAIAYYNIGRLRRTRSVRGLALVYFMGAGDYLMTTPFVRTLRLAHPDLPIYAYASTHTDHFNSPLVAQLLKVNPLIDRVFTYAGRPRSIWTDYDFSDALKNIPEDFVILPVFYDIDPVVFHRVTSVLETFGLPVDLPVHAPIAYHADMSPAAQRLLRAIQTRRQSASPAGIVCTHFGARSSGYEYPHTADLIRRLVKLGFLVVTFTQTDVADENVVQVDVSQISVTDSIELLRALAADRAGLFMVSVNSLMWPITAALNIPNLGLHTFWDPAVHQYLYPNIFIVTQHFYTMAPPARWFFASDMTYTQRLLDNRTWFTDYNPQFVADCFERMITLLEPQTFSKEVRSPRKAPIEVADPLDI